MGVILLSGGHLFNGGTIIGGDGGGAPGSKSFSGAGDGGVGVLSTAGGQVVNAAGASITGGAGGLTTSNPSFDIYAGQGGVGVKGENVSLVNAGNITGGMSGGRTLNAPTVTRIQAAAVQFTGGVNSIELQAGSVISGNVLAFSKADTFKLGGDTDSSFDVSSIGGAAQYRGFGKFEKTGDSTWTLSGTTGDVTAWTLSRGTLSVSDDANLGAVAGGLTLDGGTLQVTGTQYTSSARPITLGEHGGGFDIVDVNNAFTVAQTLSGQGALWKRGDGTLILSGDNRFSGGLTVEKGVVKATTATAFGSGVVNIASGAKADMSDLDMTIGGLEGAGVITMGQGDLTLDGGFDSTFAGVIDGTGGLTKTGTGTQTLSGINTYTGLTTVTGGTLSQGAAGAFNTTSSGYTVGTDGTLALGGFSTTVAALSNGGSVTFGGTGGTVLNVTGNYSGSGGLLVFNSVLGDDASNTDKLVVNGNTSGTTRVSVNNLGGSGASTLSGMELISVGGNSAGEFTQQGRIAAGAYDYSLMRGTGADANNWYLSSSLTPPAIPPVDPPVTPPVDPAPGVQVLRPEAGAYIGNLAGANSMFTENLDDRLGETEYTDEVTGEHKVTSLWMRTGGGRNRSEDSSGQLKMKANRYSVLLGGDLAGGSSRNGSTWRLGGLAGYGNDRNTTTSDITGYRAKGEVDGYTAGLYGTWYANGSDEAGLYVDNLLQYSWFNNTVIGDELANESYKSKGLSTSLESGYVFDLGSRAGNSYFLQPKAQLAWSGIHADDYTEQNGTRVSATGGNNVRSSLGVKAFMKGYTAQGEGKQQSFKPYAEVNWINNSEDYGVRMDGINVSQEGSRNIAEFRVGVEGPVMPQLNVTTSLAHQAGSNGWSDTAGTLGLKYSF
ncbi:Outer membrane protein IcsA autotransporter [Pseudomonas fluorescens]|uniref:Outer membrane protein IcsA autotransporter n=2 Tax=Pseudomonas fluorescens TaxID=294 RepID=A0A5E7QSX3_PSEFL|nr:Outer membrane protein IcsA autotransporter [Pseudomonas fluorescens]